MQHIEPSGWRHSERGASTIELDATMESCAIEVSICTQDHVVLRIESVSTVFEGTEFMEDGKLSRRRDLKNDSESPDASAPRHSIEIAIKALD